jgi:hypothetical protein
MPLYCSEAYRFTALTAYQRLRTGLPFSLLATGLPYHFRTHLHSYKI